jgi:HAD superfamily hydrolase (TIGR01549 family)
VDSQNRPAIKAVLFDMDDTLIDWSGRAVDWVDYRRVHLEQVFSFVNSQLYAMKGEAAQEAFIAGAIHNIELAWIEAYETGYAPHIGTSIAQALNSIGVPNELLNRERLLRAYEWGPVEGVVAFPDALDVLPQLRAAGLKLGVITNSSQPMWMRDIELKAFSLIDYLDGPRLSAADVGYLKPHPAIFETALAKLGFGAHEVVFVGDNPLADIQGAQSVKMRAVLRHLADGSNHKHATQPDAVINSLYDLLPVLDQWFPDWRSQVEPPPTGARVTV